MKKHLFLKVIAVIVSVIALFIITRLILENKTNTKQKKETVTTETEKNITNDVPHEQTPKETNQKTQTEKTNETVSAPIEILKTVVAKDDAGVPNVTLTLKNISQKDIDSIKVEIKTFNDLNEPVKGFVGNNAIKSTSLSKIPAGTTKTANWVLYNYEGTTKVQVEMINVHFVDGTSWSK